MAKSKKYDVSELDGLKDLFNDAVGDMAQEVLFRIQGFYDNAISKFYSDYDPLYYNRTYSSYEGSSGSKNLFSPENIFENGNGWTAKISIDSSYIPGNPYRADKDWVFERTFWKGIHGINTKHGWGIPERKQFMRIKEKQLKSYTTYTTNLRAKQTKRGWKASKNVFTTTKKYYSDDPSNVFITQGKRSVMKKYYGASNNVKFGMLSNMVPSPKALVSNNFKQLTRKKNMKKMFMDILSNKI